MSEPRFDPDAAARPGSGVFGLSDTADAAGVVLVPVPWDATTSYRAGTARGPAAILEASHQVDLHDVECGPVWRAGIAMLPQSKDVAQWNREARALAEPIIEAGGGTAGSGDLKRIDAYGEKLNAWVRGEVLRWQSRGRLVGVVGGDHSTPFGAIEATARRYPGLGILHVDAHADLRRAYEGFAWSHASIMYNVIARIPEVAKVVQVGIRDLGEQELQTIEGSGGRIATFFDAQLATARFEGESWGAQCARIVGDLPRDVYVSFDIDGLDPSLCPHTGTPVPGGLGFQEAAYLIGAVARSGRRIVGFDLNEVAPGPEDDANAEWDANVGARLLYKLIGWALRSRITQP